MMRCGVLRVDLVVVSKKKREMLLFRGESVLRTYRIALGPAFLMVRDRAGAGWLLLTVSKYLRFIIWGRTLPMSRGCLHCHAMPFMSSSSLRERAA